MKANREIAKIRQMMKEEGFHPTTQPATVPAAPASAPTTAPVDERL
jgi:hypothetical protein